MAVTNTKSKAYLKNVGKSFGYAALDVFEHYNPTLTNLYKSSKEAVTEAKRSMREAKMQAQQMEVESDKGGLSYILEDLASGKWYNKDRETENEKYLSKIEKEDWGDDTSAAEAVAETAKNIMKQNEQKTREISTSLNDSAHNISNSIGYASAKSAEYIVKNYATQTRALYNLTSNGFDRVTNVLLSINNSIDVVASMGEGLNAHMKNSAIFYINATQSLNRIDTNIEKLVKMQESANKSPRGISRKNLKGIENLVDADGNIDLVAYMKMVKDNMDQYKSLAEALKNNKEDWIGNRKGGNMLSNTVISVVDAMLPKFTKEAMKMMNETLRDAMTAGLMRGSVRASRSKNPIANILGDMFLPKDGYKDKIDTRNYEKGQVAWDGIARKSLVEVIPTYLAKIYAALGGEEKYYDYEAGKFVKLEAIKQGHEYDKKVAAVRAGGKMRTDILEDIRKNAPAARKAQLENEVESFFLQAFVDGYDFVEIASLVNDASFRKKYGITRESAKYIINYIGAKDTTKARRATGFVAGVARGRNEFGNTMRRKESSGTSTLVYTSNGFSGGPSGNMANSFATMADNFGKTQAFYLRGIYMMTGNIYGAMQQGQINSSYRVRPDRRPNAAVYFNPDTGRYSRRRSAMTRNNRNANGMPQGRAASRGATTGSNNITIEDRAKYMGMSDEQILEAKKREDLIKKYQQAFNGQQINPIQGTDSEGQPKTRSRFASALSKAKDIYEAPFAAMTDMINSFTLAVNNMFWGNKDKKGLIDRVSDYLSGLMTKIFGDENGQGVGLGQAMKDEWNKIKTVAKNKATSFMGNLGARNRAVRDRQMAEAVYNQVTGQSDVPGHARGRQITKTGLIAVSEGELVIPSEFNPYYHGTTNKRQQIANENRIINRFYGGFATGGTVGAFANGQFVEDVDPTTGKKVYKYIKPDGTVINLKNKAEYTKKLAQYKMKQAAQQIDDNTGAITYARDGANLLGSGVMDFIKASLFGTEKQQEEDKKKINMKLTEVFKEMGNEKGAMGIGAIAGTGVSLLTGAIVGPLAGAALGAGAGLLLKSEKIQTALFGEVDENGDYSKPIGNFIMKKLPNIGLAGGIGLVGGTLLGSPVIGAIVGSTIGFATQSNTIKEKLFGKTDENGNILKEGLFKKELQERIKKAAPNIAAGGIAGLLVGPFGLAGNLILGSAMGYLSTSNKFHEYFFGDGKDDKGLAGIIHEKIVKNLDDLFHNTGNAMKGWLRKTGAKISKKISMAIDKAREDYNKGNARGLRKALGWAAEVPGRAIKGAANTLGGITKRFADRRREKNLAKGYEVWNAEKGRNASASERAAMRKEGDMSTAAAIDRLIANSDEQGLDDLSGLLKSVLNPDAELSKKRSQARSSLYSDLYNEELMGGQINAKLIDKIVKIAGQGEQGSARLSNLLDKYKISGDQRNKIMQSFGVADKDILGAKDTANYKTGQLQLLSDKYGINMLGKNNYDIANYLKAIEHDKNLRYGENVDPTVERDTKYQKDVVTLLEEINNNAKLYFKEKGIAQSEEGTYSSTIDKNGRPRYYKIVNGKKVRVSEEEGRAGSLGQRNIGEKFTDIKGQAAETVKHAMDTVKEPVKEALTETVEIVRDQVISPLTNSVKVVAETAKDLYGIAAQGYRDANPEIDTNSYYGPTSQVDIVNKFGRIKNTAKTFGNRVVSGGKKLFNALNNKKVEGRANGGNLDNDSFLDMIADKVVEKVGGVKEYLEEKYSAAKEKITTHIDAFGNPHKYTTNNQGEMVPAGNDSTTKKSKKFMDKFMNSVNSIPGITTAIGGLSNLIGILKNKLVGDDKDKEQGIFGKLINSITGEKGLLGSLLSFFTGSKGAIGTLLSKFSLGSVIKTGLGLFVLGKGLDGAFDDLAKKLGLGGEGNTATAKDESGETHKVKVDEKGNVVMDENGNYVDAETGETVVPETGSTKVTSSYATQKFSTKLKNNIVRGFLGTNNGSVLDLALRPMSKIAGADHDITSKVFMGKDSLLQKARGKFNQIKGKFAKNAAGEVVDDATDNIVSFEAAKNKLGRAVAENVDDVAESAATGAAKKGIVSTIKDKAKSGVKNFATNVKDKAKSGAKKAVTTVKTKSAAVGKAVLDKAKDAATNNKVLDSIFSALKKFGNALAKAPGFKKFKDVIIDKLVPKLAEAAKNAVSKGTKLLSKIGDALETIAWPLKIAAVVWDVSEGAQDARNTFQITTEPSASQRLIAGAIRAIKNFIPFIGSLIPDSIFVDIFCEVLAPLFGIDVSKLKSDRAAAEEEAKEAGFDSVTAYLKASKEEGGLGDYTLGEKAGNAIKSGWQNIKQGAAKFGSNVKNFFGGDKKDSKDKDKKGKAVSGKTGILGAAIGKAKDLFNKDKSGEDGEDSKSLGKTGILGAAIGKAKELFKDGENPVTGILGSAISGLKDSFSGLGNLFNKNKSKQNYSSMENSLEKVKKLAGKGDLKSILEENLKADKNDDDVLSPVWNSGFELSKLFLTATSIFNKSFAPVTDSINESKEIVKGMQNSSGNNVSAGGSGFISQYDPRYQGYQVSGQNFAAKGCGPAVAAMAGKALGKNISVGDAVAGSAGYQNGNGVSIDYFQSMLGSKGINTRYISGGSSADLYNSIAHGDKVVLLGRDPYNTSKENSPFGPNNHYVLATGLDSRGNVIINDPENNGPRSYSPSILNSAKFGVAGSNSGIRRLPRSSRFIYKYSGGSSYDTEIAKQVWAFFIGKGYSPECTAGIMGNIYAESGMKPDAIQSGGKGPAAGICQWENYNTRSGRWKAMADYAASKGKNWTDLDSQLNYIHIELTSHDINQRMSGKIATSNFDKVGYSTSNAMPYVQWKVCKDIERACYLFEIAFERAGKPHMDRRMQAAAAYYNLYSGKTYTYNPSVASANYTGSDYSSNSQITGTSSTGSTESGGLFSNIWNIVSDIGTVFSNAFSNVFDKSGNSNSSDTTYSQEKQVYGNSSTGSTKALISKGTAPVGDVANNFPYFGQGEDPWAKESYGQGTIKSSGCGPTSMAMVARSYGINTDPDRLADWSVDNGHRIPNNGTSWAFFPAASKELGLNADQFSDAEKAKEYLNQGIPVIGSMKPGDFTKGGHYIVFSGLKGNRIFVNDPASRSRTGNVWDVDSTFSQAKQFWAISNKDGTGSIDNSKLSAAGSGLVSYEDLANYAGGSSGILMKARPGSINNMPARIANGKLVPVSSFSGGASDIASQTRTMLTNLGANANRSSGINPELVTKLIASITQILERIANNTAPVNQIYQALVAYIQSGGDSGISEKTTPIRVNKSQNNNQPEPEIDSSITTLVGVLAELAKG